MRGRYFRYLFENREGSLFYIGSVYDKENQKTTNYIYMVGSYCRNTQKKEVPGVDPDSGAIPEVIDILVMGGYTIRDIGKLLKIMKSHHIKTILLPYLAPIQRLVLTAEAEESGPLAEEISHFLKDPYVFLKSAGVEQSYFLYGNGEAIDRMPEEMEPGVHFEPADSKVQKLTCGMEGTEIPVVRAGYIVENGWLFYFGIYGLNIYVFSDFTRDYFSHAENIRVTSENADEDYAWQTKRLVQEYLKKFGSSPATTVIMFVGPLYALPSENESFMSERELGGTELCAAWNGCKGDSGCMIRCMHGRDYDVMERHRRRTVQDPRFGMLLLGNANLNRYYPAIAERFRKVRLRIRGITVPNCGSGEDWNHQICSLLAAEDRIYWICSRHDITSVGVISDIVCSSVNNRLLMMGNHEGCCMSGYLIPKEDLE